MLAAFCFMCFSLLGIYVNWYAGTAHFSLFLVLFVICLARY